MRIEPAPLALLRLDVQLMLLLSETGRILRRNNHEGSAGPRLSFVGCAEGNLLHVRHDMSDEFAAQALAIAKDEPPWRVAETSPACLQALIDFVAQGAPVGTVGKSIIYALPHGVAYPCDARIVIGESAEGARLYARLARDGMPRALFDAGFVSVDDFWAPWCVAMVGDEIAAIAFAARINAAGAEVGVYTFSGYRGRGLAAAVTAGWAGLESLKAHALFYSTSTENLSSQRGAARLSLPLLGARLNVD